MTRHVPFDPWPDVRWDALVIVGGLVLEVPEGWTASVVGSGIRLDRELDGVAIDLRSWSDGGAAAAVASALESASASAVASAPASALESASASASTSASASALAESIRRVGDQPDALVLEAADDRFLVAMPEPDDVVLHDLRIVADARVRVTVACSARDWPTVAQIVDGILDSRWHQPVDEPVRGDRALAAAAGSGPTLPWRTPAGLLDQLVRFRDRGLVPGAVRRSEIGLTARELGFVGRFGGLTDKGDELVTPVVDHDAVLVVESSDPARDDPPMRWACWMQGQQCVVRAGHGDGSESLGFVRPGALVAHLLRWLDIDPVGSVGAGEPVTITRAQYQDRSGPCPSDVAWFRRAWAEPRWRSVNGWSHEAGAGVHALLVPGVGALAMDSDEHTVTLRPERTAVVVRRAVEGVNAFTALTGGPRPRS